MTLADTERVHKTRTWEGKLLVDFHGDTAFTLDTDEYKPENDFDEILKDLQGCRIRVRIDILDDVREDST